MTFVSLTFLLFFPLVVAVHWWLPRRWARNAWLVVTSYAFYGWWDYRFCSLLAFSTVVDFVVALAIQRSEDQRHRKLLVGVSLLVNLGLLGFFKYANFFVESLAAAALGLGFELSVPTLRVVLPVGISFYTFQTLSYTLDVYRDKLTACRSFVDYAAYVAFFPQLVAGPIERGTHLVPQFQRERRFDAARATEGCRLILWGFFKKAAVADNLGLLVDAAYGSPDHASGLALVVATIAFAFQIYCDFSGYSDMAIGCARFFGIDLMRNFAYPYFSQSIAEFWRRWHISLSTWFRDYVYIPMGGSRSTRRRTAFNMVCTFVVSGLWHGAAWNFVIWGAINGVVLAGQTLWGARGGGSAVEKPGGDRRVPGLRAALSIAGTFLVACLGWVFFRTSDLATAATILERIGTLASGTGVGAMAGARGRLALGLMFVLVAVEWVRREHHDVLHLERVPRWLRWGLYSGVIWVTLLVLPPRTSPFIYFQF